MKRLLILLTGALLITVGLAGCGQPQENPGTVVQEPEKQTLILAGIDLNDPILSAVETFNETSEDTVITVKDYGDQSGVLSNDAFSAIYEDIAGANPPDMYLMSSTFLWPTDTFISRGVFADLSPFLDSDPALSRDDFFPTVLNTVQQGEALFYFPVDYGISGILGPATCRDGSRFSLSCIPELREAQPEDEMLFGELSPMELIHMEVSQNWARYVNRAAGTCHFDTQRFLDVLNAARQLPQYRPTGREEMLEYSSWAYLLDGRQRFVPYTLSGFETFLILSEGAEGTAETVLNPFASDMVSMTLTDSKAVLDVRDSFAISSTCKDPGAAWQFLRTFLEEDYQQPLPTSTSPAFPVNIHAFQAGKDKLLAEGSRTEDPFAPIEKLIESAERSSQSDVEIESIVTEEASAYLSGDKTDEEAARMIQERVSAYLAGD